MIGLNNRVNSEGCQRPPGPESLGMKQKSPARKTGRGSNLQRRGLAENAVDGIGRRRVVAGRQTIKVLDGPKDVVMADGLAVLAGNDLRARNDRRDLVRHGEIN